MTETNSEAFDIEGLGLHSLTVRNMAHSRAAATVKLPH